MKVYLDLLFLLNAYLDFFLLIMVKLTLRRLCKLYRLVFASLTGGLTTFSLLLNTNYIFLTTIKILLTFIIVIIAFGYKDILYTLKNAIYLFMMGIILGGVASFIHTNIHNRYYYLILLIIITPFIVYLFFRQNNIIKKQYKLYYQVKIIFNGVKDIILCGFLDSGNNLKDPITKKYIIIVNKNKLKGINKIRSPMYVPVKTINSDSLIACYKPDKLFINNKEYKSYLIGLLDKKIFINGVDCLLNNRLLEDIW